MIANYQERQNDMDKAAIQILSNITTCNINNSEVFVTREPLAYEQSSARCTKIYFKHPRWVTTSGIRHYNNNEYKQFKPQEDN